MHILIIDITSQLPAVLYGGTERVIYDLGKSLTNKGHKLTYLVKEGSVIDFANVIIYDQQKSINEQIPEDVDIIHFHSFIGFEKVDKPYIFTMHGNGSITDDFDINTVFLTQDHAKRHGADCFVYNGLDWSNYPITNLEEKRTYYHFLGKASWNIKNLLGACKIVVKAKAKLTVMGGDKWTFKNIKKGAFYKLNPAIEYFGMVDNERKMKIMSKSKGLIFPVLWNEPFGLAIIESLYAGCPVFGPNYGSLPELIPDNIGYTSSSISEISQKMNEELYSARVCHEYALKNFSSEVMADGYLRCYKEVLQGKTLNKKKPLTKSRDLIVLNKFKD